MSTKPQTQLRWGQSSLNKSVILYRIEGGVRDGMWYEVQGVPTFSLRRARAIVKRLSADLDCYEKKQSGDGNG